MSKLVAEYFLIVNAFFFISVNSLPPIALPLGSAQAAAGAKALRFYEEPVDTFLTKSQPAILRCKIENARTGFFKCNDQWSPEPATSRIIQIGNKQILTMEQVVSRLQLEDYRKSIIRSNAEAIPFFSCVCQGWLHDDTVLSRPAQVKLAYINHNFEWEPMPSNALIGKSTEMRCLPPEGEPRPVILWLKNGQSIERALNRRLLVSHEGSLLINDVRAHDTANYTCVAENLAGKRFSEPALLTVTENKGWSEWSNWTECSLTSSSAAAAASAVCGEGLQTRTRTCLNPPTVNNAIGCDGFPTQTISCHIVCSKPPSINNMVDSNPNRAALSLNLIEKVVPLRAASVNSATNKGSKSSEVAAVVAVDQLPPPQPSSSISDYSQLQYKWTAWSQWSMVCNADCMRSRKRECKPGYLSTQGAFLFITDDKLDPMIKYNKCKGPDIEYSNCTFYCEKSTDATTTLKNMTKDTSYQYMMNLVMTMVGLILFAVIVVFVKRCLFATRNPQKEKPSKKRKSCIPTSSPKSLSTMQDGSSLINDSMHPIYYSVQPNINTANTNNSNNTNSCVYSTHEQTYMDMCTLLPPLPPPITLTSPNQSQQYARINDYETSLHRKSSWHKKNKQPENIHKNYFMINGKPCSCSSTSVPKSIIKNCTSHLTASPPHHSQRSNGCPKCEMHSGTSTTDTVSSDISSTISPVDSLIKCNKKANTDNKVMVDNNCQNCVYCALVVEPLPANSKTHLAKVTQNVKFDMNGGADGGSSENAFHILKLINERKAHVYSAARHLKVINDFDAESDMFVFNVYKSGGIIEIPKYSIHALVPDDTFTTDISIGIYKTSTLNLFALKDNQTILSSIYSIKTTGFSSSNGKQSYPKPVVLSIDHSAQFAETDWDTCVFYKSPSSEYFQAINEQVDSSLYSQLIGSRCYIMMERDGMYLLVGQPKSVSRKDDPLALTPAIKQMRFAILLVNDAIKIFLAQNTRAATESLYEQIQRSNGKIIKMPEMFELSYPNIVEGESSLTTACLDLDMSIIYNSSVVNSDSTSRRLRLSDVWNASADFIVIEVPFALADPNTCKWLKQPLTSNLEQTSGQSGGRVSFDMKVSLAFEGKLLFAYTNMNTNTAELHTANCNQQEFYSSVNINPVFIPLQVQNLLDEYVLRCFKLNTLRRNDWRLFSDLLKCDKNVHYFANKENNSFELIMSLWLMINLSRAEREIEYSNLEAENQLTTVETY